MKEYDIRPDRGIKRRWYRDEVIDLVMWDVDNGPRFQLTYTERIEKNGGVRLEQRVINYDKVHGLRHLHVGDDHAQFPTPKLLHHESSPMPVSWIIAHFIKHREVIPATTFFDIMQVLKKAEKEAEKEAAERKESGKKEPEKKEPEKK